MYHIEKNDCKVIIAEEFEAQRAKKQVLKAQFEKSLASDQYTLYRGGVSSQVGSQWSSEAGGQSVRSSKMNDRDIGEHLERATDMFQQAGCTSRTTAAIELFPTLPGSATASRDTTTTKFFSGSTGTAKDPLSERSLLDFDELEISDTRDKEHKVSQARPFIPSVLQSTFSSNNNNDNDSRDHPAWDRASKNAFAADNDDKISTWSASGVGGGLAANSSGGGSNYSNLSAYDVNKFFNPIEGKYVCPADHCDSQFETAKEFDTHLTSIAHIGGSAL